MHQRQRYFSSIRDTISMQSSKVYDHRGHYHLIRSHVGSNGGSRYKKRHRTNAGHEWCFPKVHSLCFAYDLDINSKTFTCSTRLVLFIEFLLSVTCSFLSALGLDASVPMCASPCKRSVSIVGRTEGVVWCACVVHWLKYILMGTMDECLCSWLER